MEKYLHFVKNSIGRDFFVGDIHGCVDLFYTNLASKNFNPLIDRVFSVGDLVDRGLDSERALELLEKPWFFAVRGNHEDMCITYARWSGNVPRDLFFTKTYEANGGAWMINLPPEDQKIYAAAFEQLPFLMTVDTDYGLVAVVHAESGNSIQSLVDALYRGDAAVVQNVLWSRERVKGEISGQVTDVAYVLVGHTIQKKIKRMDNVLFIDTGAVFGKYGYGNLVVSTLREILNDCTD